MEVEPVGLKPAEPTMGRSITDIAESRGTGSKPAVNVLSSGISSSSANSAQASRGSSQTPPNPDSSLGKNVNIIA